MRILAIGDFHGRFPAKLRKEARKADAIVSLGDHANADKIRKLIFKYWTSKNWYEVVGMGKARKMEKESFNSGMKILKELNSLGKPVYLIWGNTDFYKDYRVSEPPIIMPGFFEDEIRKMKNLIIFDKKINRIGEMELIGHGGYLDVTEFVKNSIDEDKKKHKKRVKRYLEDERRLRKLFARKKVGKESIFAIHYTPYRYFDKIKSKSSPMHGRNVGWEPYNKVIKKYKPLVVLCGHMHEYQGVRRMGKSLIVATGAASEGKGAVIEFDDKKNKVKKVRFIR